MKFRHLNRTGGWSFLKMPGRITILAALLCLQQHCQAQEPLAAHSDVSVLVGFFSGGFGTVVAWIYSGLAACLIIGGLVVVRRRNKRPHRQNRRRTHAPFPIPAMKSKVPVINVSANPSSLAIHKSKSNSHAQPISVSNHKTLAKPFRRSRRKRVFDYSKFYVKVMKELSFHSYGAASTNGKSHSNSNGHANGHGHGGSNGHDHFYGHPSSTSIGLNVNQSIHSEIDDLIAAQKRLLEEQKNMLEQQTRLIEEKRQLLEQQTAVLKAQSGPAVDEQRYPLKYG